MPAVANHVVAWPSHASLELMADCVGKLYGVHPDDWRPEQGSTGHDMLGVLEWCSVCFLIEVWSRFGKRDENDFDVRRSVFALGTYLQETEDFHQATLEYARCWGRFGLADALVECCNQMLSLTCELCGGRAPGILESGQPRHVHVRGAVGTWAVHPSGDVQYVVSTLARVSGFQWL